MPIPSKSYDHPTVTLENVFRKCEMPYVPVRKGSDLIIGGSPIKNFDYIVSAYPNIFLIAIKYKHYPAVSRKGQLIYWENSVKRAELEGLKFWYNEFRKKFTCLLVFIYHIQKKEYRKHFEDVYSSKGRTYALVAVALEDYLKNVPPNQTELMSQKKKNTCAISPEDFKNLAKPLSYYLPELKLIH